MPMTRYSTSIAAIVAPSFRACGPGQTEVSAVAGEWTLDELLRAALRKAADARTERRDARETIARLERERVTFLDTIATLNNECNAWESALTEARADAARMRLALEALEGRWLCDCSLDGVTCENKPTCPDMIVALALDPYGHPLAPLPGGLVDSEGVFWPTCAICGKTHLTPDDGWLARHDAEVRDKSIRDAVAESKEECWHCGAPQAEQLARREETVRATIVALRKALELSAGGWEDLKALAVEKGTGRVKGLFVSAAKLDEQSAALAITDDRRATEWLARHVEEAVEPYREALLMLSFCPECDEEYPGTANHKPDCRVGLAEEQRHGITRAGRAGTDMEARAALADPAPLEWLRQHDAALLAPYRAFAEFVSRPEAFEDFAEVRRWAKSMMAHADRTAGRAGTEGQP